ncbi:MAG: polysaccharide deacetylase family protein [Candidatus Aenigmarchaeota archaeon]|nr:polysaccharide deacetylase family protein [Candidatus Aenigmarchaeota archaeon]
MPRHSKKIILWRFDDVNITGTDTITPKIIDIFNNYRQSANFAVVLNPLNKLGPILRTAAQHHQIMAHGPPHVSWTQLTIKQLQITVKTMRQRLDEARIPSTSFVFPGLHSTLRTYLFLRKYGFHTIAKGKRIWSFLDPVLSKIFRIKFVPYHHWSTEISYEPPKRKPANEYYSIINKSSHFIHIMDHVTLYTEKDLSFLNNFLRTASKTCTFVTYDAYLNILANKNKNHHRVTQ